MDWYWFRHFIIIINHHYHPWIMHAWYFFILYQVWYPYTILDTWHLTLDSSSPTVSTVQQSQPLTGWSLPEGLRHLEVYGLTMADAITMQSMRATYMVQLIMDILGTGKGTMVPTLVENMKLPAVQSQLITLDSCSMSGLQEYCGMWTDAIECLGKSTPSRLDIRSILLKAEVHRVTPEALKLAGSTTADTPVAGDDDDETAVARNMFSVKQLADFGSGDTVPSADQMLRLRWMLSQELLHIARTVPFLLLFLSYILHHL